MLRRLSERPLRLPHLRPYVPDAEDPPIYWFNSERREIVREVVDRITDRHTSDRGEMEISLNDTARTEILRLERQRDREAHENLGYWRGLVRRIARMSDEEKRHALHEMVERMATDVAGNFDPRVFDLSRHAIPKLLTALMQPARLPSALLGRGPAAIDEALEIEGDVETLRALQSKGTLVYVPTHCSNLDSILLGHALERSGLSPVIYGAGRNLFTNPIISFFMHNLGAYRVDRRIKAALYKEVLKTYSSVMVERGYHSLFFPGGTRSRSGLIEHRLKLGLAGSAVEAFSRNQVRGIARRVFFVPTTINYALVLEAETLVEDWLQEEGKARYIIEDDEFSRLDRWIAFFRKLLKLRGGCVLRFGDPLDPFGNSVDAQGCSLTPLGPTIDPASYVRSRGEAMLDPARDAAYTRELGELLVERLRAETVLMSTSLVAHLLFRRLVALTPGMDLFARLRLRGEVSISREELERRTERARAALLELEEQGRVRLSRFLHEASGAQIVSRALAAWQGYHSRTAAKDLGVEITADDPTLLLYYQNRLVPFAEDIADEDERLAAREIGMLELLGATR